MTISRGGYGLVGSGLGLSNRDDPIINPNQGISRLIGGTVSLTTVIDVFTRTALCPLRCSERVVRFFVSASREHPRFSSVGFINGGNRTLLECQTEAVHLYSFCCSAIDVIYNPACSGWSSRNISSGSRIVRLLRESWDSYFNSSRNSRFLRLQFCGGDGTFVVRAALQHYPHAQRICVVSLGPSCTIDPEMCFYVRHYRTTGDLTSVCFGSGSRSPDFTVIPRNEGSFGVFDSGFFSSSFENHLRLEGLSFQLRQVLLVSRRFGSDYDSNLQNVRESLSNRTQGDQETLIQFLRRYGGHGYSPSGNNFIEEALEGYANGPWEALLLSITSVGEFCHAGFQVIIYYLAFPNHSSLLHIAGLGAPVLRVVNALVRGGSYSVHRHEEVSWRVLWRLIALRCELLDLFCFFYESALGIMIIFSHQAPNFLYLSFGGYLVVMGSTLFCEHTLRLYAPLRGCIQQSLTVVRAEDIVARRMENGVAGRLGLVERVLGRALQIGRNVAGLALVAGASYSILGTYLEDGGTGTDQDNSSGGRLSGSSALIAGSGGVVIGLFSTTLLVGQIVSLALMIRRLRSAQNDVREIPIVEEQRGNIPRNRRLSERLEDTNIGETYV